MEAWNELRIVSHFNQVDFYSQYLHGCERHVDAGRDQAGVVGEELDQLGRRRPLRRRLVPAGFQQGLSANEAEPKSVTM